MVTLFYNLETMKTTLTLTLIALTMNSYAQNEKQQRALKNMDEQNIKLRNNLTDIRYLEKGEGDTTLLFISGWCINAEYWEAQLNFFSDRYRTIAIDLPGFGKSKAARDNWTIEEYSKDVLSFMEALDLENVVVIGHSMAGEVMLETAITDNSRIAGTVGVDNFKYIDMEFAPEVMGQIGVYIEALKNDFKQANAQFSDYNLFLPDTPDSVRNRVKTDIDNTNPHIGYSSFMNLMIYAPSETEKLTKLNSKLGLINSSAIPTNVSGLEKKCINGFDLMEIGKTSHYPMIEKPEVFNQLLQGFINSL